MEVVSAEETSVQKTKDLAFLVSGKTSMKLSWCD